MNSHNADQLHGPTVVGYFPSLSTTDYRPNLNVHMFTEDIQLGIMPIGGKSKRNGDFSITLKGQHLECEKAKKLFSSLHNVDMDDITGGFCDVVEQVAKQLTWEGCATYEIIPKIDAPAFLYNFTSKNLIEIFKWFIQITPRKDWDVINKKFTLVPASKIWKIKIPNNLGGTNGYLRTISKLEKYDLLGPKFFQKNIEQYTQFNAFNFQEYRNISEIFRTQVTGDWGWNRRDWSQDNTTEFFCFYKKINFLWAQSVLREHIFYEINLLLKRLDIKCEINILGLPRSPDILAIKDKLIAGELSFAVALDKCSCT